MAIEPLKPKQRGGPYCGNRRCKEAYGDGAIETDTLATQIAEAQEYGCKEAYGDGAIETEQGREIGPDLDFVAKRLMAIEPLKLPRNPGYPCLDPGCKEAYGDGAIETFNIHLLRLLSKLQRGLWRLSHGNSSSYPAGPSAAQVAKRLMAIEPLKRPNAYRRWRDCPKLQRGLWRLSHGNLCALGGGGSVAVAKRLMAIEPLKLVSFLILPLDKSSVAKRLMAIEPLKHILIVRVGFNAGVAKRLMAIEPLKRR